MHDNLLLATGLIRSAIWFAGALWAYRFKRWMIIAGFTLTGLNGIAFSFANAHYGIPAGVAELTAYVSPLLVALIVAGFIFGTVNYSVRKRWTP